MGVAHACGRSEVFGNPDVIAVWGILPNGTRETFDCDTLPDDVPRRYIRCSITFNRTTPRAWFDRALGFRDVEITHSDVMVSKGCMQTSDTQLPQRVTPAVH